MPCYDDRSDGIYTIREQQQTIDKLTRMLCSVLGSIEELDENPAFSDTRGWLWGRVIGTKEIEDWWKNHKKVDAERKKREAAEALQKQLKKVLGL